MTKIEIYIFYIKLNKIQYMNSCILELFKIKKNIQKGGISPRQPLRRKGGFVLVVISSLNGKYGEIIIICILVLKHAVYSHLPLQEGRHCLCYSTVFCSTKDNPLFTFCQITTLDDNDMK